MKKLSYQTKSSIFFLVSLIPSIAMFWVKSPLLDISWSILWGIGVFYWGAGIGQSKEAAKNLRKTNWYAGPTKTMVG